MNTHIHFLALVKQSRQLLQMYLSYCKSIFIRLTSKTSVMNLFTSVCIYKQEKEPDISRKI